MKKLIYDYGPPIANFLLLYHTKRKEFYDQNYTLGGAISFTP